jgi:alkaline phosphatase
MTEILMNEKRCTWGRVGELVKENIGVELSEKHNSEEVVELNKETAEKIAFNAIKKINKDAVLSWASGNHSGTFVPLFAIGKDADKFNGVIDNTDIPSIIDYLFIDEALQGRVCGVEE